MLFLNLFHVGFFCIVGNIILHVFMPETRKLYDLETLWTVGEKYDDRCLDVDDQFSIKQSDLEWLQELDFSRNRA